MKHEFAIHILVDHLHSEQKCMDSTGENALMAEYAQHKGNCKKLLDAISVLEIDSGGKEEVEGRRDDA